MVNVMDVKNFVTDVKKFGWDFFWNCNVFKFYNVDWKFLTRSSSLSVSAKASSSFVLGSCSFSAEAKSSMSLGYTTKQSVTIYSKTVNLYSYAYKKSHIEKTETSSILANKSLEFCSNELVYIGRKASGVQYSAPKQTVRDKIGLTMSVISSVASYPASVLIWTAYATNYLIFSKDDAKIDKVNTFREDNAIDVAANNNLNITFYKNVILKSGDKSFIELKKSEAKLLFNSDKDISIVVGDSQESKISLTDSVMSIIKKTSELKLSDDCISLGLTGGLNIVMNANEIKIQNSQLILNANGDLHLKNTVCQNDATKEKISF